MSPSPSPILYYPRLRAENTVCCCLLQGLLVLMLQVTAVAKYYDSNGIDSLSLVGWKWDVGMSTEWKSGIGSPSFPLKVSRDISQFLTYNIYSTSRYSSGLLPYDDSESHKIF
jgi:hypothetical protein